MCVMARLRGRLGRTLARLWVAWYVASLPLQALAQIAPTPGSGTQVYAPQPNVAPLVNIARPNAAGVSNNQYSKFNVSSAGAVLNNGIAGQSSHSQVLGTTISGNPSLSTAAKVILNQVVAGGSASTLAGALEVAGSRADVVLANPYGITCAGCGFINTLRVTLTTGVPTFGANGGLTGFNVAQGMVAITGNGLDGSQSDILDLVARSVQAYGQINAQSLGIYTGSNTYDYAARMVTATSPVGAAPSLALDSSVLGGMYANRIHLGKYSAPLSAPPLAIPQHVADHAYP